jgi:hypothetical protein
MTPQTTAPPKLQVTIVYNGVAESFDYVPNQSVNSVRQHALTFFGITGDARERVRLFAADNQTELPDDASMEDTVEPGSTLTLRPRTSGGGAS